jgi:hypothetical protein
MHPIKMNEAVLKYIEQRMQELGFTNGYHWEAVRVKPGATQYVIIAYNEYWYLITPPAFMDANLFIRSDTNIFNEGSAYAAGKFNFYGVQEFSGRIQINGLIAIDQEFIRVVPN